MSFQIKCGPVWELFSYKKLVQLVFAFPLSPPRGGSCVGPSMSSPSVLPLTWPGRTPCVGWKAKLKSPDSLRKNRPRKWTWSLQPGTKAPSLRLSNHLTRAGSPGLCHWDLAWNPSGCPQPRAGPGSFHFQKGNSECVSVLSVSCFIMFFKF